MVDPRHPAAVLPRAATRVRDGGRDLSFLAPGQALSLGVLVARAFAAQGVAHPEAAAAVGRFLEAGAVRVAGEVARSSEQVLAAGLRVDVRGAPSAAIDPAPLARRFRALVAFAPWARGTLPGAVGANASDRLVFTRVATATGAMEIELVGGPIDRDGAREALGAAGLPVVGDPRHGGILIAGGPRLREVTPGQDDVPEDWWPSEPLHAESAPGLPLWRVSAATRRVVERGHPWMLEDDQSEPLRGFAPGALVVVGDGRDALGLARVDGGRVAARLWALGAQRERDAPSAEARVASALSKRKSLLDAAGDQALEVVRLVHGEADGLPGLFVDRVGPLLRVLVASRACEAIHDRVIDAVVRGTSGWLGSDPPVVEVLHLRERPRGDLECVRCLRGELGGLLDASQRLVVRERGLRFFVDPGLSSPERSVPGIGLFADQRDNRARLAALASRGGRWLNLFAHTGAFSATLLRAGADEVVSVDLSGAYLRWLEENLELNELRDPRHTSVRQDGRRYLEGLAPQERFDGIVLDPPTAAAAGRRYWSVSRDLAPLLRLASARLARRGVLLVSHNRRRHGPALAKGVETALQDWKRVRDAPPSPDFPRLRGFPEGDAFEGILAERR